MASIKGFTLRNVKHPLGREGYGLIGTMYLNGKKIGTYTDYGDGGMEDVVYESEQDEQDMTRLIIEYAKEHPNTMIMSLYNERPEQFKEKCERFKRHHPYIPESDITLQTMASNSIVYIASELETLMAMERTFKNALKRGYCCMSVKGDTITNYPRDWSLDHVKDEAKGSDALYTSLTDFDVR